MPEPQTDQIAVTLVDDDVELATMVSELLRNEGMGVHMAHCGRAAMDALKDAVPDVLVLDVMLPDINGLDLCRKLRALGSNVAILMLTARGDPMDRVLGLELGADDYLGKPFEPRELIARVRALARRRRAQLPPESVISHAGLDIDLVAMHVVCEGVPLNLTSTEFKLLTTLAQQAGCVISREALCAAIQPGNYAPLDRAVDVLVSRVRKKLSAVKSGREWIRTVRGAGYVFTGREA